MVNIWRTTRTSIATSSTKDLNKKSNPSRRHGIWGFLAEKPLVPFALVAGISCILVVVFFAFWLSRQILHCPTWAHKCTISSRTQQIVDNIGTIQGLSTVIYSIGLAALAYAAHTFSESALWPLLCRQNFTLSQIDTYLAASGGSIASSPAAIYMIRNLSSGLVLLVTINITLLPLAGAPLMGHVFNQQKQSDIFESIYQSSGIAGPIFIQKNPPTVFLERAASWYSSWAWKMSIEPMEDQRQWLIDRTTLSERGNFSAKAARIQQDISCAGWQANPIENKDGLLEFATNMRKDHQRSKKEKHSKNITVRDKDHLAVWTHDYVFESSSRTKATVVFAALNGSIDMGDTVTPGKLYHKSISSIACNISVEFVNDVLIVGEVSNTARAQLGSIAQLENSKGLNELALWFAVSPVANGASVDGAMPLYSDHSRELPLRYTSTNEGVNGDWEVEKIKHFIRVSTGATALRVSTSGDSTREFMQSKAYTLKLDPDRAILLLVIPALVLFNAACLVAWNVWQHRQSCIPRYHETTLSEILTFSQSNDIRKAAELAWRGEKSKKEFDSLPVRYGCDDGVWALRTGTVATNDQERSRGGSGPGYELLERPRDTA